MDGAAMTDAVAVVMTGPDGAVKTVLSDEIPADTPAQGVSTVATGE